MFFGLGSPAGIRCRPNVRTECDNAISLIELSRSVGRREKNVCLYARTQRDGGLISHSISQDNDLLLSSFLDATPDDNVQQYLDLAYVSFYVLFAIHVARHFSAIY
jgi:hypothetical protein